MGAYAVHDCDEHHMAAFICVPCHVATSRWDVLVLTTLCLHAKCCCAGWLQVGFPRRDPERLKVALENTYKLMWVRSIKQSRFARLGQLLGFARATSDGVFSATIWDVAVSPSWQRVGLGRAMMERLTNQLVQDGISTITLYAEPQVSDNMTHRLKHVDVAAE